MAWGDESVTNEFPSVRIPNLLAITISSLNDSTANPNSSSLLLIFPSDVFPTYTSAVSKKL